MEEINIGGISQPQEPIKSEDQTPKISDVHKVIQVPTTVSDVELADIIVSTPESSLIPWYSAKLPSLGAYYDGWTDGTVAVRPMTQSVEMALANQQLAQSGESLDILFEKCVKCQNEMNPIDLLASDRVFLLYFIRGITHGNVYEFLFTCPACKQPDNQVYDLNELIGTIQYPDDSIGIEPFRVVLPFLSETYNREVYVNVKFLRARDVKTIAEASRERGKFSNRVRAAGRHNKPKPRTKEDRTANAIDESLSENLELMIVDFMGNPDRYKIKQLVAGMHAKDTSAIREFLREKTPGIDTLITVTCSKCGTESTAALPLTESFFRPAKQRGA